MIEKAKPSVSVRNLKIAYGATTVLNDLSIDIAEGEFLVLLGSSGCGKSTLLNSIAGLNDITSGEIHIGGKNVTAAEPKDRGIGMVFQSYALYPRMTVGQNMGFGLKIRGMKKEEVKARVDRTAAFLQIDHLLKRKPGDLSGGQRQRVAIGRALVRDADVFLFDEPLSNLDAQLRSDLRIEIKKLHQALGNTMIYVTHDQIEAMTLADRIAVMKDGRIQQLAAPAEVYARPSNLFVAGFLGTPKMNFVEGVVTATDGKCVFAFNGLTVDVSAVVADGNFKGDATFGLRPEHFKLLPNGQTSSLPMLEGDVTLVETLGPETIIWVSCGVVQFSIRANPENFPRSGAKVRLTLDPERASLFSKETGSRL